MRAAPDQGAHVLEQHADLTAVLDDSCRPLHLRKNRTDGGARHQFARRIDHRKHGARDVGGAHAASADLEQPTREEVVAIKASHHVGEEPGRHLEFVERPAPRTHVGGAQGRVTLGGDEVLQRLADEGARGGGDARRVQHAARDRLRRRR